MRDEGTCIILSSHIIHDVVELCDEVAIIARGRTVIQGDPAAVSRKAGCATLEDAFMVLTGRQENETCLAV
jgi:ABC-type Na+ transport system ATPase subunit NatA